MTYVVPTNLLALYEAAVADLALVRPFAGVYSDVGFEMVLPLKLSVAILTFVQSRFAASCDGVHNRKGSLQYVK